MNFGDQSCSGTHGASQSDHLGHRTQILFRLESLPGSGTAEEGSTQARSEVPSKPNLCIKEGKR